jgi:hypothetical protein
VFFLIGDGLHTKHLANNKADNESFLKWIPHPKERVYHCIYIHIKYTHQNVIKPTTYAPNVSERGFRHAQKGNRMGTRKTRFCERVGREFTDKVYSMRNAMLPPSGDFLCSDRMKSWTTTFRRLH